MTKRKVVWDHQRLKNNQNRQRQNMMCTGRKEAIEMWVMYLGHISLFVNGDEDFVEKRFEIITLDSVHDKPLERRHWEKKARGWVCPLIVSLPFLQMDLWLSHYPFQINDALIRCYVQSVAMDQIKSFNSIVPSKQPLGIVGKPTNAV